MYNLNIIKERINKIMNFSSLNLENFDLSFLGNLEEKLIKFEEIYIPNNAIEMNYIDSKELNITDFEKIFYNLEESFVDINTIRKNCNINDDNFIIFENFS